jgi:S-DNA-T family DNA segregation ATPase FtsK/SpoIIIE
VVGLIFLFGAFGIAGSIGNLFHKLNFAVFGAAFIVTPLAFFVIPVWKQIKSKVDLHVWETVAAVFALFSALGLIEVIAPGASYAGLIGRGIGRGLVSLFQVYLAGIVLGAVLIISLLVVFDARLPILEMFGKKSDEDDIELKGLVDDEGSSDKDPDEDSDTATDEQEPSKKSSDFTIFGINKKKPQPAAAAEEDLGMDSISHEDKPYTPPPLSLLSKNKGKPDVGDIKASANVIQRTLQNFRIHVEIDEVSIGPTVTRFAVKPAEGVKLSRIVGLQNELALALAAHPIRVEAPIPGKSLVGIEIPNKSKTMLGLGSLLAEPEFQQSKKPLLASLGQGVSGQTYNADIGKMPHILIAGATGAGKSVTVHTMIMSLLYRNGPERLRFIMVDPKRVELTLYNGIPHLLTPVIKDPKKAILALKWAAKEMDRRYNVLESEAVRDIDSYHENIVEPAYAALKEKGDDDDSTEPEGLPEKMPYIVIILDELADIMQAYPKELESAIVRLAQMSRAVGIHLVLSTQRPEVNVITGLIKANVPGRIALRVASQIDSRTILDAGGAERLLGAGDMLYRGGNMSKPVRMQCGYISEDEVKKVVKYLKKQFDEELHDHIDFSEENLGSDRSIMNSMIDGDDEGDDLYEDAREIVMRAGKASTSYLQRKLRVGYARAARLMDILEENGIIGPANGSKPRDVLVRPEDGVNDNTDDDGSYDDYEDSDE